VDFDRSIGARSTLSFMRKLHLNQSISNSYLNIVLLRLNLLNRSIASCSGSVVCPLPLCCSDSFPGMGFSDILSEPPVKQHDTSRWQSLVPSTQMLLLRSLFVHLSYAYHIRNTSANSSYCCCRRHKVLFGRWIVCVCVCTPLKVRLLSLTCVIDELIFLFFATQRPKENFCFIRLLLCVLRTTSLLCLILLEK